MNISTEHIPQCKQSDSLADVSERIVDLINKNDSVYTRIGVAMAEFMSLISLTYKLDE